MPLHPTGNSHLMVLKFQNLLISRNKQDLSQIPHPQLAGQGFPDKDHESFY
jgi:hypothetical protein